MRTSVREGVVPGDGIMDSPKGRLTHTDLHNGAGLTAI